MSSRSEILHFSGRLIAVTRYLGYACVSSDFPVANEQIRAKNLIRPEFQDASYEPLKAEMQTMPGFKL